MPLSIPRLASPLRHAALAGLAVLLAAPALAGPALAAPRPAAVAPTAAQGQKARELLQQCRPVDLHADSLWRIRAGRASALCGPGSQTLQASVEQLQAAAYDAQVYAIYTIPHKEDGVAARIAALNAWHRESPRCSQLKPTLARALGHTPGDGVRAVLAIEGGEALGGKAEALRQFAKLGLLSVGPVWNSTNEFADAALDKPRYGGLSAEGRKLVEIANELGILMDASHSAAKTIDDMIAASRYPVIASHSNAKAVHDHPRNLTDAQIRQIAADGGVIGVNAHCPFVAPKGQCSARNLAKHALHLRKIGGDSVVALGLDFDGGIRPPADLKDSSQLHRLVEELLIAGMPDQAICGMLGNNVRRLMARIAPQMTAQTGGRPASSP